MPDGSYDVLVLDAFSSDAIPLHLITREALQLYFRKLAPGGVLLFHISNNHLDLRPVLAAASQDLGVVCRIQTHGFHKGDLDQPGAAASVWAVLARNEADLAPLLANPRWEKPTAPAGFRPWTDDYASLMSVLRWHWKH